MLKKSLIVSLLAFGTAAYVYLGWSVFVSPSVLTNISTDNERMAAAIATQTPPQQNSPAPDQPFVYTFQSSGILMEADYIYHSTSPYWWVNSGGKLIIASSTGSTIIGALPSTDPWYKEYAQSNPVDTDGGKHPQNIFRLVTRSQWTDVSETADFNIVADNFSTSPNHNASNGLLLFNRYQLGGQTLYYAGLRVDGTAVIKKKINGVYYTMAQQAVFPGTYAGDVANVDLIPHGKWISLKSDVVTNSDDSVTVTLSMKLPGGTIWAPLLTATDSGQYGNTKPITVQGYEGIRTDFMDVEFRNFNLNTIKSTASSS